MPSPSAARKGVSGFVYHTVPVALHVWLRRQYDYRGALIEAVRLGGDTDTVAAVVGALVGTRVGREGIPGSGCATCGNGRAPRPGWRASAGGSREAATTRRARASSRSTGSSSWLRNVLFIPLVLAHGFRRLLPPY